MKFAWDGKTISFESVITMKDGTKASFARARRMLAAAGFGEVAARRPRDPMLPGCLVATRP